MPPIRLEIDINDCQTRADEDSRAKWLKDGGLNLYQFKAFMFIGSKSSFIKNQIDMLFHKSLESPVYDMRKPEERKEAFDNLLDKIGEACKQIPEQITK